MSRWEVLFKVSAEVRAWLAIVAPIVGPLLLGWHLPQPKYMQKAQKKDG